MSQVLRGIQSCCLVAALMCPSFSQETHSTGAVPADSRGQIDQFNARFVSACRNMDNSATVALWKEDGVDLLPGMDPLTGKQAIAEWLDGLAARSKGIKVLQCDVDWKQIEIAGDVAYEWGINTQTVAIPDHPEPARNKGKITLILRCQGNGEWKLALESWNGSPSPGK